jgi:arylformamidase
MKNYKDVTVPFADKMMCFPTDPQCSIQPHWTIKKGDAVNLSVFCFGSHTGTHIDAPFHFTDTGKTVDQLDMHHFLGTAKVFEFLNQPCIDMQDVSGLPVQKGDIVLFKTKNSRYMREGTFREDFAYITGEAAEYFADIKISTLGFDFLSIEQFGSKTFPAHHAIIGGGIVIIEGLDLTDVRPGEYDMVSLPMLVKGGNGSPIRVLLFDKE